MSHQASTYHEKDGLGHTTRHTHHPAPTKEHRREVEAWFQVWHKLTPHQQATWRALSKPQQEQTKQLTAAEFSAAMDVPVNTTHKQRLIEENETHRLIHGQDA